MKRKNIFLYVEDFNPILHIAMREFCIDEPPRATLDANLLIHALSVVPDPADVVYAKLKNILFIFCALVSQQETTLLFMQPFKSHYLHRLIWEQFK